MFIQRAIKSVLCLSALLCSLNAYAIQITVKTSSNEVAGLGYTFNGKKFGKVGHVYVGQGSPGRYIFGVRVGGLMGTDVGCFTKTGTAAVTLKKDTDVVLIYRNNHCTLQTS